MTHSPFTKDKYNSFLKKISGGVEQSIEFKDNNRFDDDMLKDDANATKSGWKSIGCYKDKRRRAISGRGPRTPLNQSQCRKIAANRGHKYFGLQWGGQCFTGNDYDKYGKQTTCDAVCGKGYGNRNGKRGHRRSINNSLVDEYKAETGKGGCGGPWGNHVYEVLPKLKTEEDRNNLRNRYKDNVKGWEHIGCYKDGRSRAIGSGGGNNHDQESCRKVAIAKNHLFFGLQYGGQCFTGNEYDRYGKDSPNKCTAICGYGRGNKNGMRRRTYKGKNRKECKGQEGEHNFSKKRRWWRRKWYSRCYIPTNKNRRITDTYAPKSSIGKLGEEGGCGDGWRNSVYAVREKSVPKTTQSWINQRNLNRNKVTKEGWEYMGCFKDSSSSRDLPVLYGYKSNHGKANQETCRDGAVKLGYKYFGLLNGGQCRMGNQYGKYNGGKYGVNADLDKYPTDIACNMKCKNDDALLNGDKNIPGCGGGKANSIYQVTRKIKPIEKGKTWIEKESNRF
jgi:hypothetical protein